MKNGVVIVGAGHAGVQAAASLREEGYDGQVILLSNEKELPYHRPPLSKSFIKDITAQPQPLRGEAFYTGHTIDFRPGSMAERIDPQANRLSLSDGYDLAYDHLVLATGSRPCALPLSGSELLGVLSLRSVADARTIRNHSTACEDVVIIGGGFIGLEIATTLAAGRRHVTVVESLDRLLGRAVAPLIAEHARKRLEASGIRILLKTTIERLDGKNGYVASVLTSASEKLPATMVIIGIGVVPNVELADAAGLSIANGIHINTAMRSSIANILAIGDNASYRHWQTGSDVRLESVQNATDQAKLAARTIVGRAGDYSAVPWFWSDISDMKLQIVGLIVGSDRHILSGDPTENCFSVFHFIGDRLVAIESVNRLTDHMLGRKMLSLNFSPTAEQVAGGTDALKAAITAL